MNNCIFSFLQDHTITMTNNYVTHCHFFAPTKPHHNDNEQCNYSSSFFHACKTTLEQQRVTLLIVIFLFLQNYTIMTMRSIIVCCHFFTITKQHKRMTSWVHCLFHTCKMTIRKRRWWWCHYRPLCSKKVEEDDDDSGHRHCRLLHNRRP